MYGDQNPLNVVKFHLNKYDYKASNYSTFTYFRA